MKRLRVVTVTNLFPTPLQPHRAAYNRQQFQRLADRHDVTVLVAVGWLEWIRNIGKIKAGKLKNLQIRYFPYFYVPRIALFLHSFYMFGSLITQIPFLLKKRPDVLLASWGFPDAVASLAWCRILHIPGVIKVHGSDINVKADIPSHRVQIRWALCGAGAVVAVSKALGQRLLELGVPKEKISVIYNGVDLDVFEPVPREKARNELGIESRQKLILFVGNLLVTKGCNELLAAFSNLSRAAGDIHLYFIGKGPVEKGLKDAAARAGLIDCVHFRGEIGHSELVYWYNSADLMCLPSYNEGVPNVLLEAMACGLPVVSTTVGGIPEIVSADSGLLVKPKNIEDLQDALDVGLSRKWDSDRIAEDMRSYSWDRNLSELEQILFRVVRNRKSHVVTH